LRPAICPAEVPFIRNSSADSVANIAALAGGLAVVAFFLAAVLLALVQEGSSQVATQVRAAVVMIDNAISFDDPDAFIAHVHFRNSEEEQFKPVLAAFPARRPSQADSRDFRCSACADADMVVDGRAIVLRTTSTRSEQHFCSSGHGRFFSASPHGDGEGRGRLEVGLLRKSSAPFCQGTHERAARENRSL
jgi:hypothetical protein